MNEQIENSGTWRKFLRFPIVKILIGAISLIASVGIAQMIVGFLPATDSPLLALLTTGLVVLVAFLAYVAFVRIMEKRAVTELSAAGAVRETAIGMAVGTLLFGTTIGILWLLGYYDVVGVNKLAVIVPVLTTAVSAGMIEELLFRGIFFRIVEERWGTWLALGITSLFFGLVHLFNPNATFVAGIAIALEAGVLLGAAYIFTRRLWLAIGIHFAWNFVQGGIFGVAVSGNEAQGLLQSTLTGPNILSGGQFGAEASMIAVIVCLAAGLILLKQASNRGHFVKPAGKNRLQTQTVTAPLPNE
ncbi:MAG: CPBP family intramembrane metalloprotease [Ardenticatenaceae bacterium]|nr:CPBP family intramembrane metalloprotease [Ardenticatenaceae bacterium]